jgi:transposase
MLADALGRPMRFVLTAGQVNDATQADRLLEGAGSIHTTHVIADRGYDSERILEKVEELGANAVIPPRSNRKAQREYDRELYKERNLSKEPSTSSSAFDLSTPRHPLRQESRVLRVFLVPGCFSAVDLIQSSIRPNSFRPELYIP